MSAQIRPYEVTDSSGRVFMVITAHPSRAVAAAAKVLDLRARVMSAMDVLRLEKRTKIECGGDPGVFEVLPEVQRKYDDDESD